MKVKESLRDLTLSSFDDLTFGSIYKKENLSSGKTIILKCLVFMFLGSRHLYLL